MELKRADRSLLEALQALLPYPSSITDRVRDTNYKAGYESSVWCMCSREVREELLALGVPCGRKSEIVGPPAFDYVPSDYFRGLVDGDGSLGITANGWPFVSLTTASAQIAAAYVSFIATLTGKLKLTNRNRRDQVYNLTVAKEDAQILAESLYGGSTLRLERKYQAYLLLRRWHRPPGMCRRDPVKWWSVEQDAYIQAHSVEESAEYLGRSRASIQMRLYRLAGRYLPIRRAA